MNEKLLAALKQMRTHAPRRDQGICGNLRELMGDTDFCILASDLRDIMEVWPETTGDRFFPVEKRERYIKAAKDRTLWENPRRIALLDWLIKELENG